MTIAHSFLAFLATGAMTDVARRATDLSDAIALAHVGTLPSGVALWLAGHWTTSKPVFFLCLGLMPLTSWGICLLTVKFLGNPDRRGADGNAMWWALVVYLWIGPMIIPRSIALFEQWVWWTFY